MTRCCKGRNFLVSRYATQPSGQPELHRTADQPARSSRFRTTSATRTCAIRSTKGASRTRPPRSTGTSPEEVTPAQGGFVTYPEQVSGPKVRQRSESFGDHYGQARLFWNSMTPPEKEHIVKALQFELSKVETQARAAAHARSSGADQRRARGAGRARRWARQSPTSESHRRCRTAPPIPPARNGRRWQTRLHPRAPPAGFSALRA